MSSPRPGADHPELASEQAYIERAYDRLDEMQRDAGRLAAIAMSTAGLGGTMQSRYERDVLVRTGLERAEQLEIGDESLCFGRIDRADGERYYIGRRGVLDEDRHPLVIDWRVPAAEPFYRATGRDPMGLRLRRHLLCRGRTLLAIEDEEFDGDGGLGLSGVGSLVAALEQPRTGSMRDIVATVQAEQDEIIRSDAQGILAVQGGPGTGKTAVALHRAAYLLFTHRQRLERQGVLIVGPNRLFLRYIDQVLPALGETGADLVTLDDLVPDIEVTGRDDEAAARVKGDVRMARVLGRVIGAYQRPLDGDLVVPYENHSLVISRKRIAQLIKIARKSRRSHNRRRAMLFLILVKELFGRYIAAERKVDPLLPQLMDRSAVLKELREHPALLRALDEMWPALTPARVLRDVYASAEMLEHAAGRTLKPQERAALERPRSAPWTRDDVPLLDEIFYRVGVVRRLGKTREDDDLADEGRTYGHVLVDEVQDLSPMALRMIARRSRSGWMTVVGDLAQSVGAWTPSSWDDIVGHLKPRSGVERRELTINYRTPSEIMAFAESVRRASAAGIMPPRAVRSSGHEPVFERVEADRLIAAVAERASAEREAVGDGTVVVIAPRALLGALGESLGVRALGDDADARLGAPISLSDADTVKGLEFDAVVIVEPAALVDEHLQGLRALYVALTRATKRLAVVHAEPLPSSLERVRGATAGSSEG